MGFESGPSVWQSSILLQSHAGACNLLLKTLYRHRVSQGIALTYAI